MNPDAEAPQKDVKIFLWFAGGFGIVLGVGVWLLMTLTAPKPDTPTAGQHLQSFTLTECSGAEISSASLSNRVLVVSFVNSGCSFSCRDVGRQMRAIQNHFASEKDVQLVSFTVDPRTDTPPVLRDFADTLGANHDRWLFVTGPKPDVYKLIEGSFLRRETNDYGSNIPFEGVEQIVIVDKGGNVRKFFNGLKRRTVEDVITLVDQLRKESVP